MFFPTVNLILWPPQEESLVETCIGLAYRHSQDWTHFLSWNLLLPIPSFNQIPPWLRLLSPDIVRLNASTPSPLLWKVFGIHSPLIGLVLFSFLYLYCYFLSLILQDLGFCTRHFLFLNCFSLFFCPANSHLFPLFPLRALPGLAGHPLCSVSPLSPLHTSLMTVSLQAAGAKPFRSPVCVPSTQMAYARVHGMNECLGKYVPSSASPSNNIQYNKNLIC